MIHSAWGLVQPGKSAISVKYPSVGEEQNYLLDGLFLGENVLEAIQRIQLTSPTSGTTPPLQNSLYSSSPPLPTSSHKDFHHKLATTPSTSTLTPRPKHQSLTLITPLPNWYKHTPEFLWGG